MCGIFEISTRQPRRATIERERFTALWGRCPAQRPPPEPAPVYRELHRRYSEPHRHYHTPGHIEHCLRQFDAARGPMQDPDAVEMALWFHDAVYDPQSPDNELKSAELFVERSEHAFEPGFTQNVFDLVLATTHQGEPRRSDERFIVDIDLSTFGLPWEVFRQDSENIRREFVHLRDEDFYPAHCQFLRSLLGRPQLYSTDFFRQRYEQRARENIERYLDELAAAGLL